MREVCVAAAAMQDAIGEDVAALEIGRDLDFVDREKRHVEIARHRLHGGDPEPRFRRFYLFFAGDQRHGVGTALVAVLLIGVDAGNFWSIMQSGVDVRRDIGNGIVKSIVFGFICTFIALYQGYEAKATPEGVAHGTTRTVVIASLGVLMMDFILTALMFSTP